MPIAPAVAGPDDSDDDSVFVSAQLRSELDSASARALQSRRPLLTHLNADTTWLLSVPVPVLPAEHDYSSSGREQGCEEVSASPTAVARAYFHIVIDPWLRGSQSDVAAFFSQQWHARASACQTLAEVEEVICRIEELAAAAAAAAPFRSMGSPPVWTGAASPIDAIVVSHEFTDHMHQATLLEAHRSVPIFASSKAAGIIASWRHFETVIPLPNFERRDPDWRRTSVAPLPSWLGIGRLKREGVDLLYYHSAVLVSFLGGRSRDQEEKGLADGEQSGEAELEPEAVIYTPHGIGAAELAPLECAKPRIRTLALLHGLHDVKLSKGQLNLGAHNGLKVLRKTGARYWIGTHDEIKTGGGLVAWFLSRKILTVEEAVEREREMMEFGRVGEDGDGDGDNEKDEEDNGKGGLTLREVRFEEVGNGESLVLE